MNVCFVKFNCFVAYAVYTRTSAPWYIRKGKAKIPNEIESLMFFDRAS